MKRHTFFVLVILGSIFFISLFFKSPGKNILSPSGLEISPFTKIEKNPLNRDPSGRKKEFITRTFNWEDSKKKKVLVTFSKEQIEMIDKCVGLLGGTRAESVRSMVVLYFDRTGVIPELLKKDKLTKKNEM